MNIENRVDALEAMEHGSREYASRGQGNAGVALGTVGTALGALGFLGNGGMLGGLLGGPRGGCSDDHLVDRYTLGQSEMLQAKDLEIAKLNTEIKFRDSSIYTDQKSLEMYKYVDSRFREFEAAIANQAVLNQANKDSFQIMQERLDCAKNELGGAITRECEARKCADNTIVNYVNATFYPKMVADVTVGTTTTAQTVYNPLPATTCGCGCGCK